MKNTFITLILCTTIISTMATANTTKHSQKSEMTPGMQIFKKKMRKGCRSTGLKFSRAHTEHQWNVIKENGLLRREAKNLCPQLDTSILSDNEWDKIYTFVKNYSRDNKIIPSC